MVFFRLLILFIFIFLNLNVYAEDNLLTLKQQIERLQREVSDLSKSVYQNNKQGNFDSEINNTNSEASINLSAFDMRIYDLEKDIKSLNLQFEDLSFQIEEINELLENVTLKIDTALINNVKENVSVNDTEGEEVEQSGEIQKEKNTLGSLKINSEDLSEQSLDENEANNQNLNNNTEETNIINLSPDEQFQAAFDLLRSQKFEQAKLSLNEFIEKNSENELSGSAYYWLGEIHLLQKEFRDAALYFAQGYQQYPSSLKAPDSLYKLAESLSKIDKISEACSTLNKFLNQHPNHKFVDKINFKIDELECE
tara:strand:- start:331 stop:1260 length:930 start_codon:yes stop_codon:yes gene_type:complete